MKRLKSLMFVGLLLAAALLGWILPAVVFRLADRRDEARQPDPTIRRVDLTYASDLDSATRLQLLRDVDFDLRGVVLDRGMFLEESDVSEILLSFLRDFTDQSLDVRCSVTPVLVSFDSGTFLVWEAVCYLENGWTFTAFVDDQSGLILKCRFWGAPDGWDDLIPDLGESKDVLGTLQTRISKALVRHFNSRLGTDYQFSLRNGWDDGYIYTVDLVLLDGTSRPFQMAILVLPQEGNLLIN